MKTVNPFLLLQSIHVSCQLCFLKVEACWILKVIATTSNSYFAVVSTNRQGGILVNTFPGPYFPQTTPAWPEKNIQSPVFVPKKREK